MTQPTSTRLLLLASLTFLAAACGSAARPGTTGGTPTTDAGTLSPVEAGALAVQSRGCGGCHTGASGLLAGSTTPIPGTTVYAPNLTPDQDTGLGSWTAEQIITALRTGKDDEGVTLCSQMPRYADMNDAEAQAIAAYLASIPAIRSDVPGNDCAPPSLADQGMALVASKGCATCHTAPGANADALAGNDAPLPGTQVYAPNLTPDVDTGLGGWTDADIVTAIRTGKDDEGVTLCAAMPRYATLTDPEAAAIVAYLKSLPAVSHAVPDSVCAEKPAVVDDAGTPADAGQPATDAGTSTPDAGHPAADAGHPATDAGTSADAGLLDGFYVTGSTGNALPPAWTPSTLGALSTTAPSADAQLHLAARVKVTGTFSVVTSPCPLPYTSGTTTSCDGFTAHASAGDVVVDTWSFLGTTAPCAAQLPPAGPLSSVTGTWQAHADTAGVVTWVLTPSECSDLGLAAATARTGTAPASTDVAALQAAFTPGKVVTVRGVVTAAKLASTKYTFVLQDPAGGPNSAIDVVRVKRTGIVLGKPPNIGDAVTVTGTTNVYTANGQRELKL